jgi:lipid-A-disaccharide synthase
MKGKSSLIPPPQGPVDLLFMAAECSGDEHGARLIKSYLQKNPKKNVYAIGGKNMAQVVPHFLFNAVDHAAMGFWEVVRNLRFFWKFYHEVVRWVRRYKPKRICFIDAPSLHLRIAHLLYRLGISRKAGGHVSLYYYVAPQVWAWKPRRRFALAREIDALAILFPFERKSFADTCLPVTFTGHPFLESGHRSPVYYEKNRSLLILPGSRRQNILCIFPEMLKTFEEIRKTQDWSAICIYPTDTIGELLKVELQQFPELLPHVRLVSTDQAWQEPVGGQLVLVASGTMSLQCALEGIPGIVVYKTNPLTYALGRLLVRVPFLAMANILLGYECYKEYVQDMVKPEILARQLLTLSNCRREFVAVAEELRGYLLSKERDVSEWLSSDED